MRDRTFAGTVLLGVAAATLTAVAAGQDWSTSRGDAAGVEVTASVTGSDTAPLALALALVALAAWGALLVLRGRPRRVIALLGVLAAGGVIAAVVDSFGGAQDDALDAVVAKGATGDVFASSLTGWYWLTAVGAALTLLTLLVAVVRAPGWPSMGSRYDAPATRAPAGADAGSADRGAALTDQDMWRALDEGHDPTA